jgi:hypothetical protein
MSISSLGELELTFMRSFCRGSNLRALLSRQDVPEVIQNLKPVIATHFGLDTRGTLMNDLLAMESRDTSFELPFVSRVSPNTSPSILPHPHYLLLVARLAKNYPNAPGFLPENRIYPQEKIEAHGAIFTTADFSVSNSQILFTPFENYRHVGQIATMFYHNHQHPHSGEIVTELFLLVKPFGTLATNEAALDPYRKFPLLDCQLYRPDVSVDPIIIRGSDVISHVAVCPYESEEIGGELHVVISLDRVSFCFHPQRPWLNCM